MACQWMADPTPMRSAMTVPLDPKGICILLKIAVTLGINGSGPVPSSS